MTTNEHQKATECSQLRAEADRLRAALQEILDEAEGDFDCDIIITAARGALKECNENE